MNAPPVVLTVDDIEVTYRSGRRRPPFTAVSGISFSVAEGETVALVGESGSGKSTIGKAVVGMEAVSAGRLDVCGIDVLRAGAVRRELAEKVQMIFQDPFGSLNPAMQVGDILCEPLQVNQKLSRADAIAKVQELLTIVGMPPESGLRYPGRFSGGQRQRIAIARALSVQPRLVVCDEPTSALDVSTQADVISLLRDLKDRFRLSYLFITHDLALVRQFADRVLVLSKGRIVESGTAQQVCEQPHHPYTQQLVAAAPVPDPKIQAQRRVARLELIEAAQRAAPQGSSPSSM